MSTSEGPTVREMREALWHNGWHRAADDAPDCEVPSLYRRMMQENATITVEWPAAFVYVVVPNGHEDESHVFYRQEDAQAFARARDGVTELVSEEPILNPDDAKRMIADLTGVERGWDATPRKPERDR